MSFPPLKIVVIGGGAAGFFGALAASDSCSNPNTNVTILEAGRQPLTKVRISGGGRCNVTHACFDPAIFIQNYPRGSKALRGAFTRFQARDTVEWFAARGVRLKTEADGRMFPTTDDSATIIECLTKTALSKGVNIRTGAAVVSVKCNTTEAGRNLFLVELRSGEFLECDRLLLATGSSSIGHRLAKELGHKVVPPVPSLFTFNISDSRLQDLAGISVENVCLQLPKAKLKQTGPVLVTHWGLSGPASLKLSAWGARFLYENNYQSDLLINWLSDINPEDIRTKLLEFKSLEKKAIVNSCPFSLPRRLWEHLVIAADIDSQKRWAELSNKAINKLILELTQGTYKIRGKGVFKEEFVTCGGVNLKEVNFKTMESRCCPGLYFAGEILDIDGVTGGFNFQSAWTTGWLAGEGMKVGE
ncbi:MAG: NAD(P)/FAD-dependent oxidoreductase [Okeania sp. SIO3I5]|uniref:NAD(P)/FAD-dependent oxidoreductase n=1 Tax=Okeania sp. SIO3I5 TaxID=2607805 RepID=UPI0013B765B9|nr:NAD(P)/FAD-dependent oxidoreductase [Okeania sp. SIO3I5]NEQ36883.1 NAD(P)/FAD-dependent oxidoreductase [Okeania sp. SIO3I5]